MAGSKDKNKKKEPSQLEKIRSWWEVPAIAHFCSLFRAAFNLSDFEIEELEEALLADEGSCDGDTTHVFLADLIARLLRGCYGRRDIGLDNFELWLVDIMKHRWEMEEGRPNPLQNKEFQHLSLRKKVEIIHALCDYRLDAEDVQDLLKGLEADSLRLEALGTDNNGASYWYFYGTRLYKEDPEIIAQDKADKKKQQDKKKRKKLKEKEKKKKQKGKGKDKTKNKVKHKKRKKDDSSDSDSEMSDQEEQSKKKKKRKHNPGKDSASDASSDGEDNDSHGSEDEREFNERWSLICSTAEDWSNLAESFRGSRTQVERRLYKTLMEDFVPEIPEMIAAKDNIDTIYARWAGIAADTHEKLQEKKLLDLAPRRASERIQVLRIKQEEEERLAAIALAEEQERQMKEEAELRKKLEEEKKKERERRAKLREEAMERAREAREKRARLREEKAWLLAQGKEIPPELLKSFEDSPQPPDAQDSSDADMFELDDDVYIAMYKVFDSVKAHEDAWPFAEPVDESYAPGYHDIIEHPMDLSTIEKKLNDKVYTKKEELVADFQLMFDNCLDYNGPNNEYTEMAQKLERLFKKNMRKEFPKEEAESDDEYQVGEDEIPVSEIKKKKKKPGEKGPSGQVVMYHNRDQESPPLGSEMNNSYNKVQPPFPYMPNEMQIHRMANGTVMSQAPGGMNYPPGHPMARPGHPYMQPNGGPRPGMYPRPVQGYPPQHPGMPQDGRNALHEAFLRHRMGKEVGQRPPGPYDPNRPPNMPYSNGPGQGNPMYRMPPNMPPNGYPQQQGVPPYAANSPQVPPNQRPPNMPPYSGQQWMPPAPGQGPPHPHDQRNPMITQGQRPPQPGPVPPQPGYPMQQRYPQMIDLNQHSREWVNRPQGPPGAAHPGQSPQGPHQGPPQGPPPGAPQGPHPSAPQGPPGLPHPQMQGPPPMSQGNYMQQERRYSLVNPAAFGPQGQPVVPTSQPVAPYPPATLPNNSNNTTPPDTTADPGSRQTPESQQGEGKGETQSKSEDTGSESKDTATFEQGESSAPRTGSPQDNQQLKSPAAGKQEGSTDSSGDKTEGQDSQSPETSDIADREGRREDSSGPPQEGSTTSTPGVPTSHAAGTPLPPHHPQMQIPASASGVQVPQMPSHGMQRYPAPHRSQIPPQYQMPPGSSAGHMPPGVGMHRMPMHHGMPSQMMGNPPHGMGSSPHMMSPQVPYHHPHMSQGQYGSMPPGQGGPAVPHPGVSQAHPGAPMGDGTSPSQPPRQESQLVKLLMSPRLPSAPRHLPMGPSQPHMPPYGSPSPYYGRHPEAGFANGVQSRLPFNMATSTQPQTATPIHRVANPAVSGFSTSTSAVTSASTEASLSTVAVPGLIDGDDDIGFDDKPKPKPVEPAATEGDSRSSSPKEILDLDSQPKPKPAMSAAPPFPFHSQSGAMPQPISQSQASPHLVSQLQRGMNGQMMGSYPRPGMPMQSLPPNHPMYREMYAQQMYQEQQMKRPYPPQYPAATQFSDPKLTPQPTTMSYPAASYQQIRNGELPPQ